MARIMHENTYGPTGVPARDESVSRQQARRPTREDRAIGSICPPRLWARNSSGQQRIHLTQLEEGEDVTRDLLRPPLLVWEWLIRNLSETDHIFVFLRDKQEKR